MYMYVYIYIYIQIISDYKVHLITCIYKFSIAMSDSRRVAMNAQILIQYHRTMR